MKVAAWKDRTNGDLYTSLRVCFSNFLWGIKDNSPQSLPEHLPAHSPGPFWLTLLLFLLFLHAQGPPLIAEFLPTMKHGVSVHSDVCYA